MFSLNVRELEFDACILELSKELKSLRYDKIPYFVVGNSGKVHLYDIKSGTVSFRDIKIPADKFPGKS